nr:hypothetical protein [Tanacetum cinerariifolium]
MKSWLVQKQTALGKDKSNPLTVDTLLKTIWSSMHHLLINKVLTIPGQTATGQTANGKEISNPFMAGSLSKTIFNTPRCDEDRHELMELTAYVTAVSSQVSAVCFANCHDFDVVNLLPDDDFSILDVRALTVMQGHWITIKKASAKPASPARDPHDVETIERLQQRIQELEFEQLQQDSPA